MSSYEIRRSLLTGKMQASAGADWRLPRYTMSQRFLHEDKRLCQGPSCPVAGQAGPIPL